MATNNMHNLTTLIKRLEAATSRLEDIASSVTSSEGSDAPNGAAVSSRDAGASSTHGGSPTPRASTTTPAHPPPPPKGEDLPTEIEEFDKLLKTELADWLKLTSKLGQPLLSEQSSEVKAAFEAQRTFLLVTSKAKKPDPYSSDFMEVLGDTQKRLVAIDEVRQSNRASPLKEHLSMVADGAGALGWVTIDSKPADVTKELFGGAQMYGNKILKANKDKDAAQVEWVQSFYKVFLALVSFIKEHYPRGIPWNPQGVPATQALKEVQSKSSGAPPPPPAPPAGGAPPPPPPPPPGSLTAGIKPQAKNSGGDMNAVFSQLNQGSSVTSGLKKVDPSQQTHKNPSLRASAGVPTRSASSDSSRSVPPSKKPKPESMRTKKPPRKELDGNKWIIENYENHSSPLEIEAEINHSVLITKCKNTTIRVKGKGNAISIDSSTKTSIVIDSLVSSVDVIKCPSFALQVLGTLPTVLLDQVDGATIYLSKESLETEVFTSKSSNINVYLPPTTEDGDYEEANVPEQLKSVIKNGKLVTEIVEHKG